MDYEKLMEDVQKVSKTDIKKIVFEIDQMSINKVKEMEIGDDVKRKMIDILKNRTFLDMLLVNALKTDE